MINFKKYSFKENIDCFKDYRENIERFNFRNRKGRGEQKQKALSPQKKKVSLFLRQITKKFQDYLKILKNFIFQKEGVGQKNGLSYGGDKLQMNINTWNCILQQKISLLQTCINSILLYYFKLKFIYVLYMCTLYVFLFFRNPRLNG
eukprot:TRINITY_DN11475_c0_g1_i6.p2 TRINITY_DN11475_c0_g1~~TRINITY_DN11475_c0_g1_i6.p2  ORF type:complete len:147 (+),score=8.20 TRINITY_DN11475_c0_g1_i6:114-554(+)